MNIKDKVKERLIELLGGVPVRRISTRGAHLPYFNYILVKHTNKLDSLTGREKRVPFTGREPMITIDIDSDEKLSVFVDNDQYNESMPGVISIEKVPRKDIWETLTPYFYHVERQTISPDDALCILRKVISAAEPRNAHQLSYDLSDALHNYPRDTMGRIGAQITLEALYVVYVHYLTTSTHRQQSVMLETLLICCQGELKHVAFNTTST